MYLQTSGSRCTRCSISTVGTVATIKTGKTITTVNTVSSVSSTWSGGSSRTGFSLGITTGQKFGINLSYNAIFHSSFHYQSVIFVQSGVFNLHELPSFQPDQGYRAHPWVRVGRCLPGYRGFLVHQRDLLDPRDLAHPGVLVYLKIWKCG